MQITGTDEELEQACDKYGCHALSLTLLGRFLFDAHRGDIRRIDRVRDLQRADALTREERHRSAWKVLEAYENWLAQATAMPNEQWKTQREGGRREPRERHLGFCRHGWPANGRRVRRGGQVPG